MQAKTSVSNPGEDTLSFLIDASERLVSARSVDEVVQVLRECARDALGAEGIAVVIRDHGRCSYVAEDAVAPLWAGNSFDENICISGWSMQHLETVVIDDVRLDDRIPQAAYAPTFVRSLLMAPIGRPTAVAALGAYWSDVRAHDPESVRRLESLARLATIAVENARLLRAAEENGRQRELMIEAGRMGMWSFDVATAELETSEKCRANFGRDPSQPFSYADLHAAIHEDDKARVADAIERSLKTGCAYDIEYRLITPAGDTRWIGIRAEPSYNVDGSPKALAGLSIDITDRKNLELALQSSAATLEHLVEVRTRELITAQQALRQAQKLEAMGQLTGGVAHDFNNLLTPIIGSLDLLQRRQLGGEREQRMIDGAIQSADRARTLVQRLLAFARRQPLKPEAVDAVLLINGMRDLLATTVGPQIRLDIQLSEDLPFAQADPHQIEMALLNLAVNSRDAMPEGGVLTISAEQREAGPNDADVARGHYVVLSVADNGTGMDDETRRRSIEPFFSTKGVGQGTGLGLSMAHGLASQLGGAMRIESKVGSGTKISLWFPVSQQQLAPISRDTEVLKPFSGLALLVDDEALVRASTADMLSDLGFNVIEAASGKEALACLAKTPNVDVLITDHLMPEMTGVELSQTIAAERSDLPILIISGYSDMLGFDANSPRLQKPFRQFELASSLMALHL